MLRWLFLCSQLQRLPDKLQHNGHNRCISAGEFRKHRCFQQQPSGDTRRRKDHNQCTGPTGFGNSFASYFILPSLPVYIYDYPDLFVRHNLTNKSRARDLLAQTCFYSRLFQFRILTKLY